jgi:hypothetical protein
MQLQTGLLLKKQLKFQKKTGSIKIKKSDIYRNALQGRIYLSIYFQSPIILRKIKLKKGKITLRPQNYNFSPALSSINKNIPPSKNELTFSTEGEYFYPKQRVIDTNLLGYEFFMIQRLLAHSLKIPSPVTGEKANNHGITVSFFGKTFSFSKRWRGMRRSNNKQNDYLETTYQIIAKECCCAVLRKTLIRNIFLSMNYRKMPV